MLKGAIDTPHSILVRPGAQTIFLTDSGNSMSKILHADTYSEVKPVKLTVGADSSAYDAATGTLYVVTGGKDVGMKTASLEAVDPVTGALKGRVTFNDNHVEALAIEKHGTRIFINLAQTNRIAVVDRRTMKTIALWPVPPAQMNAMEALDEAQHRLYVVCRQPGMVVAMNSDTGAVVSTAPAPLRADEKWFRASAAPGQSHFKTRVGIALKGHGTAEQAAENSSQNQEGLRVLRDVLREFHPKPGIFPQPVKPCSFKTWPFPERDSKCDCPGGCAPLRMYFLREC